MGHQLLEFFGVIIFVGTLCQWVGWKLKVPAIILLSLAGFFLGPVFGFINPNLLFGDILFPMIEMSVAIILFEGGLNLRIHEFKEVSSGLKRLFTLGVVFNWVLGTLAAIFIGGFSLNVSLLMSAILVVTGPTVIIPVLRQAKLNKRCSNFLKWEGIVNDPIGAFLASMVFQFILIKNRGESGSELVFISILKTLFISAMLSLGLKKVFKVLTKKKLIPDYLEIPVILSMVIGSFIGSELFQKGSGLFTVTLLGILIGNTRLSVLEELRQFKESITVIIITTLFVTLASTIDLKILSTLTLRHILFIASIVFVIRPIAIFLSTIGSEMSLKERLLVGFFGPRGIVAISIAGIVSTELSGISLPQAELILPVLFTIVLSTVIIHSLILKPLANILGLRHQNEKGILIVGATDWSIDLATKLKNLNLSVLLADISWYKLTKARQQGINTYYGQVLNDIDYGKPDIDGLSNLLALTDNDSYNELLCHKFSTFFDSKRVHKLPIHQEKGIHFERVKNKDICMLIDNDEALFENMQRKSYQGWIFKSTHLTEKFTFEDFNVLYAGKNPILFLIIRNNDGVDFLYKEEAPPQQGDTILFFIKEDPEELKQAKLEQNDNKDKSRA